MFIYSEMFSTIIVENITSVIVYLVILFFISFVIIKFFLNKCHRASIYLLKTFGPRSWVNCCVLGGSGKMLSNPKFDPVLVQLKAVRAVLNKVYLLLNKFVLVKG